MTEPARIEDLVENEDCFREVGAGVYRQRSDGDLNSGIVIGRESVLVIDAQATPAKAADVLAHIRTVTERPVRHLILTHHHAACVLGASGYAGAEIIASEVTRGLIAARGRQDMDREFGRCPHLFRGKDAIPGLTWPTLTFRKTMTLWLGSREVQIIHVGRGHTAGDVMVWLPRDRVLFTGDVVEVDATPYCGDAHFADWRVTVEVVKAFDAECLVPGRGRPLMGTADVAEGVLAMAGFTADLFAVAERFVAAGATLGETYAAAMDEMRPKHGTRALFDQVMPFGVARAYDEANGLDCPEIWTAEREAAVWRALSQADVPHRALSR